MNPLESKTDLNTMRGMRERIDSNLPLWIHFIYRNTFSEYKYKY
jgi:hypothetical protein